MNRYACVFIFFHFFFVHGDDIKTMIALSKSLPPSNNNKIWNTTNKNPCLWSGLTCSSSGSTHVVTKLSLSNLGLTTSNTNTSNSIAFFKLLCELESLQSLDLSLNSFSFVPTSSFVSKCNGLPQLKSLNLSFNQLNVALDEFSVFRNLQVLDLSNNMLVGEAGSKLGELKSLKSLNLSFNAIKGTIPLYVGLEELQLSSNLFSGEIPNGISQLKNLSFLDLSRNMLNGSIPYEIGGFSKLEFLSLSSNKLVGEIPRNLSSIKALKWFAAHQNNFIGNIPDGITKNLNNLDLSFNQLSGQIPSDLLSYPNLRSVDLSSNQLTGSIPRNLSKNLTRLRLGENHLTGEVPSSFQQLTSLLYLELDNNELVGEIPLQLENCQNLMLLNLASNQLQGKLAKGLGNLSKLVIMQLQENNFSGEIPRELSYLTNLITLNLSHNSLSSVIPPAISNLSNLQNLNLEENRLYGRIPSTISTMSDLIGLQLGNNMLNGSIPRMPVSLTSALNLSNNHFSGSIPSSLGILNQLEVLDLSNNNFSGGVPDSLTQMASLTLLVLSNNKLSGTLPIFSHRVTIITTGNNGLVFPTSGPGTSPGKKKSTILIIIFPIVCAVIAVSSVAVVLYIFCSKHADRVEDEGLHSDERPPPQITNGCFISLDSLHQSSIDFAKAMEVVGSPSNIMLKTGFSTYYKAIMPSGTPYWVKKVDCRGKISQMGSSEKFRQELQVLGRLSNSNVMVPLACFLTEDSAYLFYEHVHKGTVYDFLHKGSENALDWQSRYSIALGVAQGLTFLHGCTQPVLLLDLSTRTILLKSMKEPQIGDVELCRVIDPAKSTGSLSTIAGSVGYIPPEYAYTMRVTVAGNVYSFGVILLELLTGELPVNHGIELAKWALSYSSRIEEGAQVLDSRVYISSDTVRSQMLSVLKVAISCVSLSPDSRPKMRNVLRMLFNAR